MDALAEGLTGDVGHDVVHELASLVYGENGNDVRMGKLRRGACLAEKTVAHFRSGGEFLREDFEGHRTIELDVLGKVHHTHAAPSQLALERVFAGERLLEREKLRVDWRLQGVHNCSPLPT